MKTTELITIDGRQAVKLPEEFRLADGIVSIPFLTNPGGQDRSFADIRLTPKAEQSWKQGAEYENKAHSRWESKNRSAFRVKRRISSYINS